MIKDVHTQQLAQASVGLEAFFFRQMLQSAGVGAGLGGPGASTFTDMFNESLADAMSKGSKLTMPVDKRPPNPPAPLKYPVAGVISSPFGERVDPLHPMDGPKQMHAGIDIAASTGTPVHAVAQGQVMFAGEKGGYGNCVVLRHADGYETRYAHLSSIEVHVGQQVTTAAELGKVGSTGRSTGPHLHFELRQSGRALDPSAMRSAYFVAPKEF